MKKLDLTLMRTGNTLLMRVNHMDEEWRGKPGIIFKKGIYRVYSLAYPELTPSSVLLPGTDQTKDRDVVVFNYETAKECDAMIAFIKKALKHINGEEKQELMTSEPIKLEQVI